MTDNGNDATKIEVTRAMLEAGTAELNSVSEYPTPSNREVVRSILRVMFPDQLAFAPEAAGFYERTRSDAETARQIPDA